ncbi:MAG TPA: type II secretion system F family protein [Tahibacter sp.]|nr:type II secretion system F family protein [Tahibacter sp.]
MNASILIVSLLFAVCVGFLAVAAQRMLSRATHDYRNRFTAEASASLADMFLFVDLERLFRMNIVIMLLIALLTWVLSGNLFIVGIVAVAIMLMPRFVYAFMRNRRQQQFTQGLPDALLSMSGAMKAGSSLVQAIETVVAETKGPIGQEFGLLLRELRVGVLYDDALQNLVTRMPGEELRLVVAGMRISREIGGNLAEILERLSDTLRKKIEMEGKIKALTSQGRLQGIVMTALPGFLALVLFQMEPHYMRMLFTEYLGWAFVAAIVIMESIGYFFIRKIVNIDV